MNHQQTATGIITITCAFTIQEQLDARMSAIHTMAVVMAILTMVRDTTTADIGEARNTADITDTIEESVSAIIEADAVVATVIIARADTAEDTEEDGIIAARPFEKKKSA